MKGRGDLERLVSPPWTSDGPLTVHLALPEAPVTLCGKDRRSQTTEFGLYPEWSGNEIIECDKCLAWSQDLD
jgi:hypothetical protein